MDLSTLSDQQLESMSKGDLSQIDDATLEQIANHPKEEPKKIEATLGDVPLNAMNDIQDIGSTANRIGQGIIDFPKDVYNTGKQMIQGQKFSETPIWQDVNTVGNTVLQAGPHMVNDPRQNGALRLEPGSIFRQYQDLAAQPLKMLPGKAGEEFKKEYPGNPLYEHPVNSALALLPLAKPGMAAIRDIPGVDQGLNAASQGLRDTAAPMARRVLGKFPSNNATQISQANEAGLEALDRGVIRNPITHPFSSSTEAMQGRLNQAIQPIGEEIGNFLSGQKEGLDSTRAMAELDSVKQRFANDPAIVRKVEAAKKIISINSNQPVQDVVSPIKTPQTMDFQSGNKIKGLFQSKVNYKADTNTANAGKAIAGTFKDSIDKQLDELSQKFGNQEQAKGFQANKKAYGNLSRAEDALAGRAKSETRNMPVSPLSLGMGAAETIVGGAAKGGLTALGAELVKKYGSAAGASILDDVSKFIGSAGKDSSVASPVAVAASVAPHGKQVKQNGKIYEWNGSEYVEK